MTDLHGSADYRRHLAGVLVDRSPGLAGHQHYFMFLAAFAALGVIVSVFLVRQRPEKSTG